MVADSDDDDDQTHPDNNNDENTETLDQKLRRGMELWQVCCNETQGLSSRLCEQLRLVLEPTLADRLVGDYKTGKRINMKKVIPYIASSFKKDKIWLRRTQPNKRQYQILLAIDDSSSMAYNNAGYMSMCTISLLSQALNQLQVGEISVLSFGKDLNIINPLNTPLTHDVGASIMSEFTFGQDQTNVATFLEKTLDYMDTE